MNTKMSTNMGAYLNQQSKPMDLSKYSEQAVPWTE